jgi:hypothetical protein
VLALNLWAAFHVGNGPRDLQYTVVRPGAEPLLLHGAFQHALAVSAQVAVGADLARAHLCVGIVALTGGGKTIELVLAGSMPYTNRLIYTLSRPIYWSIARRRAWREECPGENALKRHGERQILGILRRALIPLNGTRACSGRQGERLLTKIEAHPQPVLLQRAKVWLPTLDIDSWTSIMDIDHWTMGPRALVHVRGLSSGSQKTCPALVN